MSVLYNQDHNQNPGIQHLLIFFMICIVAAFTSSCALTPPVQEMSNARQTISAAHEVKANVYAPKQLLAAERFMELASTAMASGDYLSAREYAVEAQQYAIKARQLAVSKQNN